MSKRFLLLVVFALILSSCGAPPRYVRERSVFEWIESILNKLNKVVGNSEEQKKLIDEMSSTGDILVFNKNSILKIFSKKEKYSDLFYSLENNSFIIKKPLFITFVNEDMHLSLDGENWIIFEMNDRNKNENTNKEYFYGDYKFYTNFIENENILEIIYTISFKLKEEKLKNIIYTRLKDKRNVVSLQKDMILNDRDRNLVNIDLKKVILSIPKETVFKGALKIEGNLLDSKCDDESFCIKSLKDIYIYAKNKTISLSFNRKDWNVSLLSFQISPNVHIKSTSDKNIIFDLYLKLNYKD